MGIGVWILLAIAAFSLGFWLTYHLQHRAQGNQAAPPPLSDRALQTRLRQVVAQQGRIAAIRLLRQQQGLGLKAAKAIVDGLVADPNISITGTPTASTEADLLMLTQNVQTLLQNQGKIEAIKQVRTQTGWGLKQAKEFVEKIDRDRT